MEEPIRPDCREIADSQKHLKRSGSVVFMVCCALLILSSTSQINLGQSKAMPGQPVAGQAEKRFDYLVREDFFAGLGGDQAALDRAMKVCEETMAGNPKHAEAMVWHGSGLMLRSSFAFRKGDMRNGAELWDRGLKEMNNAAALDPNNIGVLIARGASLLGAATYAFDSGQKKAMLEQGVADYQSVHELQKPYFDKLSAHSRGELLFGLASGFDQLGNLDKARVYFQLIIDQSQGRVARNKRRPGWRPESFRPPIADRARVVIQSRTAKRPSAGEKGNSMRKTIIASMLLVATSALAQAQSPNAEAQAAMKKLNFIVGQWKGEGWVQIGPGQRQTLTSVESVQPRLSGEILLIEGLGKNKAEANQPEVTGHDAIAFLFYDLKTRTYRFQAHRTGGIAVDTEAKVTDRSFEWSFQNEHAGTLRFTMKLTDKGEWFEIGEASRDGKTWNKFLEMTLQRVK